MSLVADGPLMNVVGRVGSSRATSSGTVSTTWSARTTQTCTSGTSVIARRPWSGEPSSAIVPVCAHDAADAVTTAANPSRSSGVNVASSTTPSGHQPSGRPGGTRTGPVTPASVSACAIADGIPSGADSTTVAL